MLLSSLSPRVIGDERKYMESNEALISTRPSFKA